jgi:O-antigen chain-terminating methyltransferase
MDDEFYIRFQNKFRGNRELIKERVKVYLPIVEPLKTIYPDSLVIDVGCGRGEWLELLKGNGWRALGVDANSNMIGLCKELGLNAVLGDAIRYLGTVKSASVSVISGFHIAEHLPFDLLVELMKESYRVLLPGGILILETPNPENYKVGALTFYIDPTHLNLLPPSLLQFLAEDSGFSKSVILRLNGPKQPFSPDVLWALFANPDYGLVAQKQKKSNMSAFEYFDSIQSEHVDFLVTLGNTLNHFESELNGVKNELNEAKNELNEAKNELNGVKNELNDAKNELNDITANRDLFLAELINIYNSRSWRITAPFRKILDGEGGHRIADILSRLFPLRTLPKRATLKITRLSRESGPRIANILKRLVYAKEQTAPCFPVNEEHIPVSPQVKTIDLDLVNSIKETKSNTADKVEKD